MNLLEYQAKFLLARQSLCMAYECAAHRAKPVFSDIPANTAAIKALK
jgi:hypothetical protein